MKNLFRKLLKWLLYIAAAGTMLLALLVGIARLFLPLVPEYQEDIRQWTAQATGYDVEFRNITATWPLAGPELKFIDVVVSAKDSGERIFVADNLTAGISLFRLVRDRRLLLNRLGVEGSVIDVRRSAEGDYFFQGLSLNEFLPDQADREERLELRLPNLAIRLTGITLNFTDESDDVARTVFGVETLEVQLSDDRVAATGDINLEEAFGDSVFVAVNIPTTLFAPETDEDDSEYEPAAWNIELAASDINLVNVAEYALKKPAPFSQASGNFSLALAFADLAPESISVELDLDQVVFEFGAAGRDSFEALNGLFDWRRTTNGGWSLTAREISVVQRDLFATRSDVSMQFTPAPEEQGFTLQAATGFLRLQDIYPLVRVAGREELLPAGLLGEWSLPESLNGEIRGGSLSLQRSPDGSEAFNVALDISKGGVGGLGEGIGLGGLSGSVKADQQGGSLEIDATDMSVDLPALFRSPMDLQEVEGLLVWRVSEDAVNLISDNVRVRHASVDGNSRFEFVWPLSDESPQIDLTATAMARTAPGVVPLLPLKLFPEPVGDWLERAIREGRVTNADIRFSGPVRKFPFRGGEGVFRIAIDVEQAILDYAEGWPRITDFAGQIVFDGPGLYSNSNRGRIGRIEFANSDIRIENFAAGLLEVDGQHSASVDTVLDFLRRSPLSANIGSIINDVTGTGFLDAALQLSLPVTRPDEYQLDMAVTTAGTNLGLRTLDWGLSEISGSLTLENTRFRATGMAAMLLDEPVAIDLLPVAETEGQYGQYIRVTGRTPVQRWAQTLSLPFADRVEGPADWNALVLIPRLQQEQSAPVHILVRSDLVGMQSRLPAPLEKTWADVSPVEIDIAFPAAGRLEVSGRLHDRLTWIFALTAQEDQWNIERGAVHAGTAMALLPPDSGVEVTGGLPVLVFDDWLALTEDGGDGESDWQQTWRSVSLDVGQLTLFEQVFSAVEVDAQQAEGDWNISVDGPSIAGQIRVPLELDAQNPLMLDMERLWLNQAADDTQRGVAEPDDPRRVPSVEVTVDDFQLNNMQFGALDMTVRNVTGGIRINPIKTRATAFSIDGDAAWLVHPNDDALRQTQLTLSMAGNDIRGVLLALGYDPVIEGNAVAANGELTWLGGPRGDFLERADGNISINMREGALLDLDPGGGRILGILSVAALPRRLAFDFSDVVDEGLAFDTLKGDFTLDDGNAYTCNLSMEGPVADLGIVGRAGFADRDYDQIAVVRPHMSNLMAAGGLVVGGPVAGAAMLLFSQIFQKPLSTLGESYHSVTGTWDEPSIEQLRGNDIDSTPLRNCEKFLADAITESLKE